MTDTSFLAKNLPDAEEAKVIDDLSMEARVKVRIAVVSSTLKLKMTVAEKVSPSKATLLAEATGGGSNMKIRSTFTLTGDNPTTMNWSADAEISGVMAGLGSTLLRGFATKKVEEIFGGITRAIEQNAKLG